MQIPVQITFRHLDSSPSVKAAIQRKIDQLERFFPRITSIKVIIEPSHLKRKQGNLFHIRIDMTVPGRNIIVRRDPSLHQAHEDIYVAIRDAFLAARRQLEDYVRFQFQQQVKTLNPISHGRIHRLFPNEDCGFLISSDGREIYFHRNSVLRGRFDRMKLGEEVRYIESEGEKGPQASTVESIGRLGHHAIFIPAS
jgi:ribosomal subunit interface protein